MLFHSLDVWHKAKSLSKSLHKAAKAKGNEPLKIWIPAIINHFWYACQVSNGSPERLRDVWFGVVHHVCGEHEWAESACNHGPLSSEEPKTPLDKKSAAAEALRQVVFDKRFTSNLDHYVRFRHTGSLENFNSMLTKYAPKRIAFEYIYFVARIVIAAIDHNMHLMRPQAKSKDGSYLYKKKYSRRSRKYHAEPVKDKKEYLYIPSLLAAILHNRVEKKDTVKKQVVRRSNDPKHISPTIDSQNPPPPTKELVANRISRLANNL